MHEKANKHTFDTVYLHLCSGAAFLLLDGAISLLLGLGLSNVLM
jgi:hypothetical protein